MIIKMLLLPEFLPAQSKNSCCYFFYMTAYFKDTTPHHMVQGDPILLHKLLTFVLSRRVVQNMY